MAVLRPSSGLLVNFDDGRLGRAIAGRRRLHAGRHLTPTVCQLAADVGVFDRHPED